MTTSLQNTVTLAGRVSADPEVRVLPSGDEMVTFRLVVPRSPAALKRSRQRVDTIECVAWAAKQRRSVLRLAPGDHAVVTGALRRRFTRAAGGPASFVSVEVESVVRTAAASQ